MVVITFTTQDASEEALQKNVRITKKLRSVELVGRQKQLLKELAMKDTEKILCNLIAEHYGKDTQVKKTTEELSELIRALATGTQADISEEIADVEIMIYQLKHLLGNEADVEKIRMRKIFRQLERMERELEKSSVQDFKKAMDCMWE